MIARSFAEFPMRPRRLDKSRRGGYNGGNRPDRRTKGVEAGKMQEVAKVALAGLLHDIGKFSQRVGNEQRWKHEAFTEAFVSAFSDKFEDAEEIQELAKTPHEAVTDRMGLCVKLGDWLASAERRRELQEQIPPEKTALLALTTRVKLTQALKAPRFFPLDSLRLKEPAFFPTDSKTVVPADYRQLWDEFAKTLRRLPGKLPFFVWQTLLQVFTHAIPSATPYHREPEKRTTPDLSLYHHARLTAAIASCLASFPEQELPTKWLSQLRERLRDFEAPDFWERFRQEEVAKRPLCLLVRGDVAGIQGWLYRIARAEGEIHRQTAKRLRGRSFYLVLLTEAISYWLLRQAQLPPCNLLFCGGGVFDLLLPATQSVCEQLPKWAKKLEEGLLSEFHGELTVNLAWVEVSAKDFYEFGAVYQRAAEKLEQRKLQPLAEQWKGNDFWFRKVDHLCPFCDTTPSAPTAEPCHHCRLQEKLGDALRRVGECDYLVWAMGDAKGILKQAGVEEEVEFDELDCCAAIVSEQKAKEVVRLWDGRGELIFRKRNDPETWWQPLTWDESKKVSAGIWWVGSDAPVAKKTWRATGKPPDDPEAVLYEGEALDFDQIAALSEGDDLLGVLRMDVDNLGAIFAAGIEPPSPSRIAELSGRMEAFFSAWLPIVCRHETQEWKERLPNDDERKGLVDNAFYLVYSGGDDLMVLGPWDLTLRLAKRIQGDFTRYCGENPNLTLSAGIVFVKPKFPIFRFALLAGEAIERAKDKGRNRITAFGVTVNWDDYGQALCFGEELAKAVRNHKLPRTFLHFLLRLYRQHIRNEKMNPMWLPLFHYMVARRLEMTTVEELRLLEQVPSLACKHALPIALGYAILATRERATVQV